MAKRTDLAMEAREIWQESAGKTTELSGVRARERREKELELTEVEVLDEEGAAALGKPVGTYLTMQWDHRLLCDPEVFARGAQRLGKWLRRMVPREGGVLVVGLGNAAVTPDAVGPRTVEHLVVTRHLGSSFGQLRAVSALAPGVLGTTGLESVETVRGVVERAEPACVVVVDALASTNPERLCSAVQLTDTGITPGSGVGNRRKAFDQRTLGVPVVAVGVPTVMDVTTLLESVCGENLEKLSELQTKHNKNMIVTPGDIDGRIHRLARLLGYGISLGLHRGLTLSDISCFVG